MNAQERFLATLRDGVRGCAPHFERAVRDDVTRHWREQGVSDQAAAAALAWDRWQTGGLHEEAPAIDLMPRPVLERPVTSPGDVPDWRARFGDDDRYPADWADHVATLASRDWPFGLSIFRGLLLSLGVSNSASLTEVIYFLVDHGDCVDEMMSYLGDWLIRTLQPAFAQTRPDFVVCREPICSGHGPVIGPAMVRRFLVPLYRRLIECAREAGVGVFIWESYGHPLPLLETVLEAGYNVLHLGLAGSSGIDYLTVRERLGPQVGLMGGIDSRLLAAPSEQMRSEVMRLVPPLLQGGRYVPMLDDRLRADADFAAFAAYREALAAAMAMGADA